MSVTKRLPLRALAVATLTAGLFLGSAVSAVATEHEDPRAESFEGNAVTCEDAGLDGDLIDKGDLTFTGGKEEQDQYVTITDVADGITVTGIVVKGGDNYNVYVPGEKGLSETPPWEELRSPLNNGGQVPQISHWYVCGTETTTTTTSTTTSTTETTTSETSTTTSESTTAESTTSERDDTTTTTTSSVAGGAVAPTSEAPVSPAGDSGDLASTGFSGAWLVGLGALLLLGGGALVFLTRMRRSS
ncbi:hypothetical protein [Prauserella flavalba]|uniref:Gram-positive cocci surface proteins LPxTG domain-containing protein n=1 Tax=Prauserella flavalba TaxID=1477506 RepID=A0A318LXI1_9PSEU|nr:hypothetical protein [Prauserella flavalba]PXY33790.1 hypothetical protein BA062_16260 [Prauserella flavalba]